MFTRVKRLQNGYSLLEMLIALAIIASLVSLAAVSIRPASGPASVRSDAREIAAGLRRIRAHAISTGEPAEFYLNLRTRQHQVLGKSEDLNTDIKIKATVADSMKDENGVAGVRFYPNGSSTGGDFELSAGAAVTYVHIDWMTGRISIKEGRDEF